MMGKEGGKHEMTVDPRTHIYLPSTCVTLEQLGEEPGCSLRKEVISPLVTDAVGIYRSKTVALSV